MNEFEGISDTLERIARMTLSYALIAALFIFSLTAVPYPLDAFFKTPLLLMAVFYWSVYRPTLLPPAFVFLLGLAFDLLSASPLLGLHAIIFLVCRWALLDQRRFLAAQGFAMVWIGYAAIQTAYIAIIWLTYSLKSWHIFEMQTFAPTYFLGLILFPIIFLLLYITHKILPADPDATTNRLSSQNQNITL